MGMFTSIIHPATGHELQIKCGYDYCDTYRVGDVVDWKIWVDKPGVGKLLDGVYEATDYEEGRAYFVIIKDHIVRFVLLKRCRSMSEASLEKKYKIEPWKREWWTEEAWLKHDMEEINEEVDRLKYELQNKKEELTFLGTLQGKTDKEIVEARDKFYKERVGRALVAPIIKNMFYSEGLLQRVFSVKPVGKS